MIRRRAASHKRMSRRWAQDHARRHESSRVRPDHVSCCIVHPSPGNRRSVTSVACPRAIENAGGAKDEGISGRGSYVRFTSCVASRSWLFEYVRIYIQARTWLEARQGCQRWRRIAVPRREENARSRRDDTTEARNGAVKRRPHRSSSRGRGNRADQGARLIQEMGRSRSYTSLVRRSELSQGITGHRRV